MKTLLKRLKARRKGLRRGKGFSLVELAVVIVVIGILVAIAVPMFGGMEDGANRATAQAAAANGASMVASEAALGKTVSDVDAMPGFKRLVESPDTIAAVGNGLTDFCVTAVVGEHPASKGPGCGDADGPAPSTPGETDPMFVVTLDTSLPGCTTPGVNVIARAGADITAEWQGQSKEVTDTETMTPPTTPGEFQVTFTGSGAVFGGNRAASVVNCLKSVDRWDEGFTTTAAFAFSQAANLTSVVEPPAGVMIMTGMFQGASSFNQPINDWDVSDVRTMGSMFSGARAFNQPLNDWDVSRVTDMTGMFQGASSFNQPINDWDVSQVTTMTNMFHTAYAFNQPLNDWDVSQVTNMSSMFDSASSFNQPLNDWDVSQVTTMNSMFEWATSFNLPINGWQVDQVTTWTNFKTGAPLSTENTPLKFRG